MKVVTEVDGRQWRGGRWTMYRNWRREIALKASIKLIPTLGSSPCANPVQEHLLLGSYDGMLQVVAKEPFLELHSSQDIDKPPLAKPEWFSKQMKDIASEVVLIRLHHTSTSPAVEREDLLFEDRVHP
jgi:hypothetical protein